MDATLSQLVDTLFEQHQQLRVLNGELARVVAENGVLRQQLDDLTVAYELSQQAAGEHG